MYPTATILPTFCITHRKQGSSIGAFNHASFALLAGAASILLLQVYQARTSKILTRRLGAEQPLLYGATPTTALPRVKRSRHKLVGDVTAVAPLSPSFVAHAPENLADGMMRRTEFGHDDYYSRMSYRGGHPASLSDVPQAILKVASPACLPYLYFEHNHETAIER